MKSKKQLDSFIKYCQRNPGLRFWQALANWSGAGQILYKHLELNSKPVDTFYWDDK